METRKKFLNAKTLFASLFSFCIVFCGQDTLIFGTLSNSLVKYSRLVIYALILLVLLIYLLFLERGKKLSSQPKKRNFFIFIGLFMTAIVLPLVIFLDFGEYTHMYLQIVLLSALFIVASRAFKFRDIAKYISYIVVVVSLVSNLFFLIAYVFGANIFAFLPTIANEAGYEFYFAGLVNIPLRGIRNYGIFREPGVYSIYLCLALIFLIFNVKSETKVRLAIHAVSLISLVLSLLSSRSTTGYFCLVLILIASLGKHFTTKTIKWIWMGSLILIGSVILLIGALNFNEIFGKLFVANESLSSRALAPFYNLILFFRSPIIGNGANKYIHLFSSMCYIGTSISNTDTFVALFASYGVFVGLAFLCGFRQGCYDLVDKASLESKFPVYLVLFSLFLLCESENFAFSTLFHFLTMFPLYGFVSKVRKKIIIPTRITI